MDEQLPAEPEALPAAVNLPLLAEDVTFDISIKRAAPKERTAVLEEKRAALTEKAAAAGEKGEGKENRALGTATALKEGLRQGHLWRGLASSRKR